MNHNIDEKKIKLFRKLARKNSTVIQRIRKVYREVIRDNYLCNGYCSDSYANSIAKKFSKNISIRRLLDFWVVYYDANVNIFPKNAVKTFTDKQKITLDIE